MEFMKEELGVCHFSHHHPLVRTNSSPSRNISCSGCNLSIISGNDYYRCKICSFFLHKVCYNMPRKTRHPGHPSHYLNLLVMPSSAEGNFKCKACGQHVTGFYYNCAECGFCYHILCSVLPPSIAITSYSHSLKLEFSLPYDFECDICQIPCYNGLLYRRRLCEFDSHLACALIDERTQSLHQHPTSASLPDPLTRQIIYSSASLMEPGRENIHYGSERNELMQLVAQGNAKGIKGSKQESINVAVTGWDEKLYSPRKKHTVRNGKIEHSAAFQIKPENAIAAISPDQGGNIEHSDQSSMLSGDMNTLPSYQFSDSYFSLDLARSYSTNDQPKQEINNGNHDGSKLVQDGKEMISYTNDSLLERITRNLEPDKQEISKPGFSFNYLGPEYKINEALLIGDGTDTTKKRTHKKLKKRNATRDRSSIKNQSSVPDTAGRSECSCWWKLIYCCYYPRYERETVISK